MKIDHFTVKGLVTIWIVNWPQRLVVDWLLRYLDLKSRTPLFVLLGIIQYPLPVLSRTALLRPVLSRPVLSHSVLSCPVLFMSLYQSYPALGAA